MNGDAATLTGLAVGDSLGMPFEMCDCQDPELVNWDGDFRDGFNSPYTKDLKAGQWTDDTQMATALATSLLAEGTYSPADAARRYLAWYTSGKARGIGGTTRQAMDRLATGLPWTQSGMPGAEGNGTAMRAAPIGLFFWHNIQAAAEMASLDARLTHKSAEAEAGSIAVAVGVTALLQGVRPDSLISKVLEWVPDGTKVKYGLMQANTKVQIPVTEQELVRMLATMGTGAHVVQTVPAAFLAVAMTSNFRDAVRVAILAGGDTDTTGAIAGALAGTFYGALKVDSYLKQLEDAQALRDLELKLFDASRPVYR